MKKIIFALVSVVALASCGGNDTATDAAAIPKQDTVVPQVCIYSYDSSATEIGFGAFKFTEKKEVKGGFLKFMVDSTIESEHMYDVFKNAQFTIEIEGLSTKDPARDNTLKKSFFAAMDSTAFITGKVRGVGLGATPSGMALIVDLKLNNVVKEIILPIEVKEDQLIFTGTINLDDFKAEKALASLNKACKDLHKGPDGVSKTWNEVNIYVSTKLKNSCK